MRRSLLCAAGVTVAALAAAAGTAHAQGSAVQTHSSCATAMGAAGVASPCDDGSAVLFNPAALALQPSVIGLGWTGINTSGSFTYDADQGGQTIEREGSTSSVPFGFLSYRFNQRLAAAIGVFNPYGLHIFWPEDFEGRFVSYDTRLRNIYIQPTVSFALTPMISLGAGLDIIRSSIDLNQRADLATTALPARPGVPPGATFGTFGVPFGTDFADVHLTGDGTAFTFHVGAVARISPLLSVGARYMHGADVEFDGRADFTPVRTGLSLPAGNPFGLPANTPLDALVAAQFSPGGALTDQDVKTSLPVPNQLVLGIALTPFPALKLLADYQRTGWETWDETRLDFQEAGPDATLVFDYEDTHTYRLGGEFSTNDALILRAGFIYNTAAQQEFSVSPLLPEAERNYYSAGLGYRFSDALQLDLGYQLVDQADRRGRVRGRPEGLNDENALRALNVGVYGSEAHVFNVTLSYRFGANR